MAFNEFFVETGGNDVAAGSTTGASAVTTTNGDWGSVTANRYTAAAGTPFAATNIGDWASIYIDAAVLVVYIAQVTAINGGGSSIDLSTTAKYGVSPTVSATARSCKIGGAWATPWAFINTGATAIYNSTRINVKATTYASGATSRVFANVGSQAAPLVWRGYSSTPGDLDADFTTTKPAFTFTTTGFMNVTGIGQFFNNFSITSNRAGATLTLSTACNFKRCRVENTTAGASSNAAFSQTTGGQVFTDCWFKATSTATRCFQMATSMSFKKCVFEGGLVGLEVGTSPNFVVDCVCIGNASHGISFTVAAACRIFNCTFKGCGGDGIRFLTASVTTGNLIANCLFDGCAGWGINNSSGSPMSMCVEDNAYYVGGGSGTITGLGDQGEYNPVTESSSPAVSSSDPTISATTFNSASMPRPFEGKSFTGGYYDAGAVQRQVVTGGGGGGTTLILYPVE